MILLILKVSLLFSYVVVKFDSWFPWIFVCTANTMMEFCETFERKEFSTDVCVRELHRLYLLESFVSDDCFLRLVMCNSFKSFREILYIFVHVFRRKRQSQSHFSLAVFTEISVMLLT